MDQGRQHIPLQQRLSVTTPVFTSGSVSLRTQAAGTVTYTATASNTTGLTYTLDAGSLALGNTINATTGAVTYAAGWSGTSIDHCQRCRL